MIKAITQTISQNIDMLEGAVRDLRFWDTVLEVRLYVFDILVLAPYCPLKDSQIVTALTQCFLKRYLHVQLTYSVYSGPGSLQSSEERKPRTQFLHLNDLLEFHHDSFLSHLTSSWKSMPSFHLLPKSDFSDLLLTSAFKSAICV